MTLTSKTSEKTWIEVLLKEQIAEKVREFDVSNRLALTTIAHEPLIGFEFFFLIWVYRPYRSLSSSQKYFQLKSCVCKHTKYWNFCAKMWLDESRPTFFSGYWFVRYTLFVLCAWNSCAVVESLEFWAGDQYRTAIGAVICPRIRNFMFRWSPDRLIRGLSERRKFGGLPKSPSREMFYWTQELF